MTTEKSYKEYAEEKAKELVESVFIDGDRHGYFRAVQEMENYVKAAAPLKYKYMGLRNPPPPGQNIATAASPAPDDKHVNYGARSNYPQVTPSKRQNTHTNGKTRLHRNKRIFYTYEQLGIPKGAYLQYLDDPSIQVEVGDAYDVYYEGKKCNLHHLTRYFAEQKGKNGLSVCQHNTWLYNGKILKQYRKEKIIADKHKTPKTAHIDFAALNVPVGSTLVHYLDSNETVTVNADNTVNYRGTPISLTAAHKIIARTKQKAVNLNPLKAWKYNDVRLWMLKCPSKKTVKQNKKRHSRYIDFVSLGVPVGSTLTYYRNDNEKVTVNANNTVNFRGTVTTLTAAYKILAKEQGTSGVASPACVWNYNGVRLSKLRNQKV